MHQLRGYHALINSPIPMHILVPLSGLWIFKWAHETGRKNCRAETDQVGAELIEEPREQPDQLQGTESRLVSTKKNLSRSNKVLCSVSGESGNQPSRLSIIIPIDATMVCLLYYKFFLNHCVSYRGSVVD